MGKSWFSDENGAKPLEGLGTHAWPKKILKSGSKTVHLGGYPDTNILHLFGLTWAPFEIVGHLHNAFNRPIIHR